MTNLDNLTVGDSISLLEELRPVVITGVIKYQEQTFHWTEYLVTPEGTSSRWALEIGYDDGPYAVLWTGNVSLQAINYSHDIILSDFTYLGVKYVLDGDGTARYQQTQPTVGPVKTAGYIDYSTDDGSGKVLCIETIDNQSEVWLGQVVSYSMIELIPHRTSTPTVPSPEDESGKTVRLHTEPAASSARVSGGRVSLLNRLTTWWNKENVGYEVSMLICVVLVICAFVLVLVF